MEETFLWITGENFLKTLYKSHYQMLIEWLESMPQNMYKDGQQLKSKLHGTLTVDRLIVQFQCEIKQYDWFKYERVT